MCRQAWFPPGNRARNYTTLLTYLKQLEHSAGGDGNGAAWVKVDDYNYLTRRGMSYTAEEATRLIVGRPERAWGVFHARMASGGAKINAGCHPHIYRFPGEGSMDRLVLLTHNGTWGDGLKKVPQYPSDSAFLSALIAQRGWSRIAPKVDQTICAAVWETKDRSWRFLAWRNSFPLVLLADGTVASEGSDDDKSEFTATNSLLTGGHALDAPRVGPLTDNSRLWHGAQGWCESDYAEFIRQYAHDERVVDSDKIVTINPDEATAEQDADGKDDTTTTTADPALEAFVRDQLRNPYDYRCTILCGDHEFHSFKTYEDWMRTEEGRRYAVRAKQ